jgi:hypothetical protein
MSTIQFVEVLLLINKHEREGRITIERGIELQKLFTDCYNKGVSCETILEVLQ